MAEQWTIYWILVLEFLMFLLGFLNQTKLNFHIISWCASVTIHLALSNVNANLDWAMNERKRGKFHPLPQISANPLYDTCMWLTPSNIHAKSGSHKGKWLQNFNFKFFKQMAEVSIHCILHQTTRICLHRVWTDSMQDIEENISINI